MDQAEIGQFLLAAERGVEWVLAQQREDGSFCDAADGIGGYYKTPYFLSLAGREREAQRLLTWVAANNFSVEGDFRALERKALDPFHEEVWPVYGNAWLIRGAHRLGRLDLSLKGMEFTLRHQKPSGGFYSLDDGTPFLEPVCTSWGGLAALTTGHVTEARRTGDLLVRWVADQPDSQRLYTRMDVDGNLITDVPAGSELTYYVDATLTKQIYYNPGIAMIFLCYLYRATGEERYLRTCEEILRFTERCAEDVYRFPPSGKLGMGCALLYSITGNEIARRAAIQVGEYIVETQNSEGFWTLPDEEVYAAVQDSYEVRLDITCEFGIWLIGIASHI